MFAHPVELFGFFSEIFPTWARLSGLSTPLKPWHPNIDVNLLQVCCFFQSFNPGSESPSNISIDLGDPSDEQYRSASLAARRGATQVLHHLPLVDHNVASYRRKIASLKASKAALRSDNARLTRENARLEEKHQAAVRTKEDYLTRFTRELQSVRAELQATKGERDSLEQHLADVLETNEVLQQNARSLQQNGSEVTPGGADDGRS